MPFRRLLRSEAHLNAASAISLGVSHKTRAHELDWGPGRASKPQDWAKTSKTRPNLVHRFAKLRNYRQLFDE